MTPTKAWALVKDGKIPWGDPCPVAKLRPDLHTHWLDLKEYKTVRVEIREIKQKRKVKK